MELDVTPGVNAFREVVSASWSIIERISKNDDTGSFVDDWLQGNWERIVESSIPSSLRVVLEPYGNGADCNINSSRVWRPEARPTSPVYIRYIGNDALINAIDGSEVFGNLSVGHFCTIEKGWPKASAPFDHVAMEEDNMIVISTDNLRYFVLY